MARLSKKQLQALHAKQQKQGASTFKIGDKIVIAKGNKVEIGKVTNIQHLKGKTFIDTDKGVFGQPFNFGVFDPTKKEQTVITTVDRPLKLSELGSI